MADDTARDDAGERNGNREPERSTDRFLTESPVLEARLPEDLRSALGRFVGRGSIDTLGEWAREVRRRTDGDTIALEQLCHTDEPTGHWGELEGERYHFACFYDGVVLAALTEEPVKVRTESPDGAVVEARATADDLTVTPPEAVFSFGIDDDVTPPSEEGPTLEDGYATICPYVKAFPDLEAYERWAEAVPAPTVAMGLSGATDLAAELVGEVDG